MDSSSDDKRQLNMDSSHSSSHSQKKKGHSSSDEERQNQWVIDVFERDDINFHICVFKVPNSLRASKPEAYFPQVVGLGPLHHKRSELESMQMYKVRVAKMIHKGIGGIKFEKLLKELEKLVPAVRACYQIYLEANDKEIAAAIAIDTLFLFQLLCYYGIGKDTLAKSNILRHLVDAADSRLTQDGILRDTMMLENQIPIFVLIKILIIECSEPNSSHVASEKKKETISSHVENKKSPVVEKYLPQMLLGYCKALSPLHVPENYPASKALESDHLLDLLYDMIILEEKKKKQKRGIRKGKEAPGSSLFKEATDIALALIPNEIKKPIELIRGLDDLPWSTLDLNSFKNIVPPEEEDQFPTASSLCDVGVKFRKFLDQNSEYMVHIKDIGFERDTALFKLPFLTLNVNSEVVFRNLVAYEAMYKHESEPLVFTQYFELMNGIIKATKDVKVLRDHGILKTSMKDEEVVKIFSWTSKPLLRLENADKIDEHMAVAVAVAEVKKYYNGFRRVKARKFVEKCVFTLWNGRTLFAAILLLSLMALQTFCSVYGCSNIFNKAN